MKAGSINFEQAIRAAGAVKIGEFISHAGKLANCKLELDGDFLEANPLLADEISAKLAESLEPYKPRLIVPVPRGADRLGELVARHLDISITTLEKRDRHSFKFRTLTDRNHARSRPIAVVDDVFTTGSSLREISALPEMDNIVVCGVIWDRSDPSLPKYLDFPMEAVVESYLPLRVDTPSDEIH